MSEKKAYVWREDDVVVIANRPMDQLNQMMDSVEFNNVTEIIKDLQRLEKMMLDLRVANAETALASAQQELDMIYAIRDSKVRTWQESALTAPETSTTKEV